MSATSPSADLIVEVQGLRSAKGQVKMCLTADPARFPRCQEDPNSRRMSVAATEADHVRFTGVPSGEWALALIHDENGNRKLDTRLGIPSEGVGFSRNPRLMFGPPAFKSARMHVTNQPLDEQVRVKYFL